MEKQITIKGDNIQVSDGFHTFDELYAHRIELFIALCRVLKEEKRMFIWKSLKHDNGSSYDGYFIMGIGESAGWVITYHLPIEKWKDTEFACTLDNAPKWDGHTSDDVLKRLQEL